MNQSDPNRNARMLQGNMAKRGYMRWWHCFRGMDPITQTTKNFYIEYLIMNPALGENRVILGQLPIHKKQAKKPSYVMIKAGVLPSENERGIQLTRYYPLTSLKIAYNPFYLQVEDCVLSEGRISGFLDPTEAEASQAAYMTEEGTMEWDLEVCKSIAGHTGHLGGVLSCALNLLDSYWHGEGIRTTYRGTVLLNGTRYEILTENNLGLGYADKHWGRSYNRPHFQFASCTLRSKRTGKPIKNSALAVITSCPRLFRFPLLPRLMLQFTYQGEDFCYNFKNPLLGSELKWNMKDTKGRLIWHIKAQNKTSVIKLSLSSKKKDMLALKYETPMGMRKKAPLLTGMLGVGTIDLYRMEKDGLEWVDTLTVENGFCQFQ